MVTKSMHRKKVSFWAEIFMTCDTPSFWNLHILVLSTKTKICNLATIIDANVICHTIMHHVY